MTNHPRSLRARLNAKEKRPLDRAPKPIAPSPPAPLTLHRAQEISALAVGLLVLQHVEETGRTRLQEQAIGDALERVTKHLNAEQMMRLEVEAYEIVDWLVGDTHGDYSEHFVAETQEDGSVLYDPSSSIDDIVRAACSQHFDLTITYFSSRRMELNRRVISPKAIAAEVYVRAWCHERRDERIFRMSRIRSAVPVQGKAIANPYFEHMLSEQENAQQSLEFEHISYAIGDEAAAGSSPLALSPHSASSLPSNAEATRENAPSKTSTPSLSASTGTPERQPSSEQRAPEPVPDGQHTTTPLDPKDPTAEKALDTSSSASSADAEKPTEAQSLSEDDTTSSDAPPASESDPSPPNDETHEDETHEDETHEDPDDQLLLF